MTFGLTPSKNVINLFGNWLKRIPKNDLVQIRVGVCAVIRTLWDTRNDHILKNLKKSKKKITVYSYGYPLDPYVVLSPTKEAAGGDEFWVQLFEDGSSRFIQPVRLAVA
jgi:hypothetical protein